MLEKEFQTKYLSVTYASSSNKQLLFSQVILLNQYNKLFYCGKLLVFDKPSLVTSNASGTTLKSKSLFAGEEFVILASVTEDQ